jgi:hypothetical protein
MPARRLLVMDLMPYAAIFEVDFLGGNSLTKQEFKGKKNRQHLFMPYLFRVMENHTTIGKVPTVQYSASKVLFFDYMHLQRFVDGVMFARYGLTNSFPNHNQRQRSV